MHMRGGIARVAHALPYLRSTRRINRMTTKNEHDAGLGDDQGTRVGAPDRNRTATPAQHNDGPSGRPERSSGAGSEATTSDPDGTEHDREHRSGYGGKGGAADTSSDKRAS